MGANASSSAEFLTIDPSPRSAAMGGGYVASMTDVSGININPSALAFMRVPELYLMYQNTLQEFHNVYFATGTPLGVFFQSSQSLPKKLRWMRTLRVATSFMYWGTGAIPVYGNESNVAINTITAQDIFWSMGFGYNIRGYRVGGTVKYINRKLADYSGSTVAFDAGVLKGFDVFRLLPYPIRYNLRVGFAVNNLGPGISFSNSAFTTDAQHLPITFRPGISYGIYGNRDHLVDLNLGITYLLGEPFAFNSGVEYRVFNIFFFRLGTEFRTDDINLSMGTGAKYTFRKVEYRLDYSYLPRAKGIQDDHNVALMATLEFIQVGKKKRVTSLGILESDDKNDKKNHDSENKDESNTPVNENKQPARKIKIKNK